MGETTSVVLNLDYIVPGTIIVVTVRLTDNSIFILIHICTVVNAFMSSRPKELIINGTLNPPGS